MIQSWLARRLMDRVMARERAGDMRLTQLLQRPDVRFTFPGDSSWSGEHHGKQAVGEWLARFGRVGIQIWADEVVASGPPWRSTVAIRGHDLLDSPEGERVYENRYVIWAHLRWGRITDYEVYEDTQRAKALDEWLERNEARLVAA
jgi:ketosteroid isomerase-like protein